MPDDVMLAPCGIMCNDCAIYKAAQDPAEAARLAEAWRANGVTKAQPEWFRCQGCRGDRALRWSEDCRIAPCCEEKGLQHCGQCGDFPCTPYLKWAEAPEHHKQAFERLRKLTGTLSDH